MSAGAPNDRRPPLALARIGCLGLGRLAWSSCRIGSTKAAVLPVPVWAPAEHVAASQDVRDGLRLDGGGLGVALGRDGAKELGREPEGVE